jgi:hypothetical protein
MNLRMVPLRFLGVEVRELIYDHDAVLELGKSIEASLLIVGLAGESTVVPSGHITSNRPKRVYHQHTISRIKRDRLTCQRSSSPLTS